jgi:hypothetical protein
VLLLLADELDNTEETKNLKKKIKKNKNKFSNLLDSIKKTFSPA